MKSAAATILALGLLAISAWGDPPAVERLDASGDPLPPAAVARFGTLRWWHDSHPIRFVAYIADDKELLTIARKEAAVRVWDVASGKQMRKIGDDAGTVTFTGAVLSADRKTLVISICDEARRVREFVQFWDIATGTKKSQWNAPAQMDLFALSPDSQTLAVHCWDQCIRLCRSADGTEIRKFGGASKGHYPFADFTNRAMAFTRDGKSILLPVMDFKNDKVRSIKRYDVESGKESTTGKVLPVGAANLTWVPDGSAVAWSAHDNLIHVWNVSDDREISTKPAKCWAQALAFSPDGKTLVSRDHDHILRVWDAATGKEIRSLGTCPSDYDPDVSDFDSYGGSGFVCPIAFTTDGKHLASATTGNTIRQWHLKSGQEVGPAGHRRPVDTVGITADGKTVVTRTYHAIRVWDAGSGKELHSYLLPESVDGIALAADARIMVLGESDGTIRTWDAVAGKENKQWPDSEDGLVDLAVSPDGKTVAARDLGQTIRLYDRASAERLAVIAPPAGMGELDFFGLLFCENRRISGAIFSPDGGTLAVLGQDHRAGATIKDFVELWDVGIVRSLCKLDVTNRPIRSMRFAPDGRTLATGSVGKKATLWEVATGKERLTFPVPGTVALAFTRDSKALLAAGSENAIHVFSTSTGKELGHFASHDAGVRTLAVTADGKTLISGGVDTTALAFDLAALPREEPPALVDMDRERLDTLWKELASADSCKAYQAVLVLVNARPALDLLRERLKPVPTPDSKRVSQLIADLEGDKSFSVRQRATEELEKLGELAAGALEKVLDAKPGLETRARVEALLGRLTSKIPLPPERLQSIRAVEVLERIGSAEAQQILDALSKGAPGARLTREASAALRRLR